jgi:hypothetical protein
MIPFRYTSSLKKHRSIVPLVIVSVLLAGNSRSVPPKPTVQITQGPTANPGGPVELDFIEGMSAFPWSLREQLRQ